MSEPTLSYATPRLQTPRQLTVALWLNGIAAGTAAMLLTFTLGTAIWLYRQFGSVDTMFFVVFAIDVVLFLTPPLFCIWSIRTRRGRRIARALSIPHMLCAPFGTIAAVYTYTQFGTPVVRKAYDHPTA